MYNQQVANSKWQEHFNKLMLELLMNGQNYYYKQSWQVKWNLLSVYNCFMKYIVCVLQITYDALIIPVIPQSKRFNKYKISKCISDKCISLLTCGQNSTFNLNK